MSYTEREMLKKRLLEQIEAEERLVRIYEADIQVTANLKRPRPSGIVESLESLLVDALGENEEDDDWLTALDALQSHHHDGTTTSGLTTTIAGTRTSSSSLSQQQPLLDTRWHDDPRLRRALPNITGIVFSVAKPVGATRTPGRGGDDGFATTTTTTATMMTTPATRLRSFYFQGHTMEDSTMVRIDFAMTLEVEFIATTTTKNSSSRISKVDLEFLNQHEEDELLDIMEVAKETRNIPLLFRQLLSWSKFHHRRNQVIELLQQQQKSSKQLVRVSTSVIQVNWSAESFLNISWRWKVSWATSGKDVLEIQTCRVAREHQTLAAAVMRSKGGLDNLIQCMGGDCEKALHLLLQAALPTSQSTCAMATGSGTVLEAFPQEETDEVHPMN
jgi:hypothetical protein